MMKTLTASTRLVFSSMLETMWAIGVSSVVGHLSTQVHSEANFTGRVLRTRRLTKTLCIKEQFVEDF